MLNLGEKAVRRKADIVVIGAGAAGLFSALTAAKLGAEVVVCEEHKEVGLPNHCAGHISILGLEGLGVSVPANAVENEIKGAVFYSPSGHEFRVRMPKSVTYVIDRAGFDKNLEQLAEKAGAELHLGARVESLLLSDAAFVDGVRCEGGQELASNIVVDAEGCSSLFLKQIGLETFNRSCAVNAVNGITDHIEGVENDVVEVYLGQKYAPGLFAWIIPRRDGSAKIGLATGIGNARERLQHFVKAHPIARSKLMHSAIRNLSYHIIPLGGPIPKTYHNGFIAVGDSASQVKPTTGGGVIMGLTCAKIAGEIAYQATQQNNFSEGFLSQYQDRWNRAIGFDMAVMKQIRFMLDRLSDPELDKIISFCSQLHLDKSLRKVENIDFQGKAILPLLKNPAAWTVAVYSVLASLA